MADDLPAFPHELPDDLEPTIDLNADRGTLKKLAMEELIARVMSGIAPRSRPLHSWEPDVLDERHIQAILLRAAGLKQNAIAHMCGWTEAWTSTILNHPDAQYILTRLLSYAADNVIDITTRIKATAPEALDTVVEVMRTSSDEKVRSNNAFEILKMAGYGPQKVGGTSVNVTQVNVGAVPSKALSNLTNAIQEAQQIPVVRSVTTYRELSLGASAPPTAQGSADGDDPVALSESGQEDGSRPPATDSPAAAPRREPGEDLDDSDYRELQKLQRVKVA